MRGLVAGGILAVLATGAVADTRIACKIGDIRNGYFQPTEVQLRVDAGYTRVDVRDSLLETVRESPLPGLVEAHNARRTTYVWTVRGLKRDPRLNYGPSAPDAVIQRLTLRPDGTATLVTIAPGLVRQSREFRAAAACRTE